jgi:anti-sigma factor RsiW
MANLNQFDDNDRENLVAYLDGELDAAAAQALEAKLGLDPKARREADLLRKTWDLLDYLPRPEPSPTFTTKTLDRLAVLQARPRPKWPRRLAWTFALLLAFALGFLVGRGAAAWRDSRFDHPHVLRDLPLLENLRLYRHIEDFDFLERLANDPELFGDENRD